jgi:hypothetical protein
VPVGSGYWGGGARAGSEHLTGTTAPEGRVAGVRKRADEFGPQTFLLRPRPGGSNALHCVATELNGSRRKCRYEYTATGNSETCSARINVHGTTTEDSNLNTIY